LNLEENLWTQVCDFTPNPDTPNWRLMTADEFTVETKDIEGIGEAESHPVPLPKEFGGDQELDLTQKHDNKDHGPNMMEFNIKTSTEEALKILRAKQEEAEQVPVFSPQQVPPKTPVQTFSNQDNLIDMDFGLPASPTRLGNESPTLPTSSQGDPEEEQRRRVFQEKEAARMKAIYQKAVHSLSPRVRKPSRRPREYSQADSGETSSSANTRRT